MTKILPTIGPSNSKDKDIEFISNRYKVVRLNGSHNTIEWHKQISRKIKKYNKNITVLIDLPGAKPRINIKKSILINKNDIVIFYHKIKPKIKYKAYFVKISNPLPKIKKLRNFLVNDNQYKFKSISVSKDFLIGRSTQKFILESKKGLNIPDAIYDERIQKKNILNFIKKINYHKVSYDAIGISYVQSSKILKILRKRIIDKSLISKIENYSGVKNAKDIIKNSNAVMIDRGDLSAEIGEQKLFEQTERIKEICDFFSKPILMATQNLYSMRNQNSPTQSEIFSIGYAKKNYFDMLMLSDETAISKNWKKILIWLENFLKKKTDITNTSSIDLWSIVNNLKKTNIIIFSKKGYVFKSIKINNENKYYIFSESKKLEFDLNFYSNIKFNYTKFNKKNLTFIQKNISKNSKEIFKNSLPVVLVSIMFPKRNSRANSITFLKKKDFIV
jgi:pyruvate kinase